MKQLSITRLTACVAIFLLTAWIGNRIAYGLEVAAAQNERPKFRYVIISNKVDDTGRPQDTWRTLLVLLEPESFSEDTLKELFSLLSKRFPDPEWLKIDITTSLKQIPTPEEAEAPSISGGPDNLEFNKYHWAYMMRMKGSELFRYNPNPPRRDLKTVIIKGKDPFR